LYPSKFAGRHKTRPVPATIVLYVATLAIDLDLDGPGGDLGIFVDDVIFVTVLERVCLSARLNNCARVTRGLPKRLIRGRCKPYEGRACKMAYVVDEMIDLWNLLGGPV